MTFSVALGTYNGARFLREQLDSLAAQSRPPDELVICDDASTDGTVEIVTDFAASAPFPVHITINGGNLGSTQNFGQAIAQCRGDIIALCDQDDVWLPDKLRRLEETFAASPKTGLVFSDAEIVGADLQPLGSRLWRSVAFPPRAQRRVNHGDAFKVLLRANVVTGATMAFRADLRDVILPLPEFPVLIHDGWIALVAAAVSQSACLPEPLILYRQHAAQQLGVQAVARAASTTVTETLAARPKDYYREHLRQLHTLAERLSRSQYASDPSLGVPAVLRRIESQARHIRRRVDLPDARPARFIPILKELVLGRYSRYSNGLRSAIRDLL